LCSSEVMTAWPPEASVPRMTRFKDSVAFLVKTIREGSRSPKSSAATSRARSTSRPASMERLWPLRPGLPPHSLAKRSIASYTASGFG